MLPVSAARFIGKSAWLPDTPPVIKKIRGKKNQTGTMHRRGCDLNALCSDWRTVRGGRRGFIPYDFICTLLMGNRGTSLPSQPLETTTPSPLSVPTPPPSLSLLLFSSSVPLLKFLSQVVSIRIVKYNASVSFRFFFSRSFVHYEHRIKWRK